MSETGLHILLYACIVVFAVAVGGFIIEVVMAVIKVTYRTRWVKLVPYTELVRESIKFTNDILAERKIKYFPAFRIRYYRHKKYAGVFNGEVVVYMGSNPDVPELVDTVLHEVMHFVQSQTNRQYKFYERHTQEKGYWNNPFEVESRAFAAKYSEPCLKYLESRKLIKRV